MFCCQGNISFCKCFVYSLVIGSPTHFRTKMEQPPCREHTLYTVINYSSSVSKKKRQKERKKEIKKQIKKQTKKQRKKQRNKETKKGRNKVADRET